MWDVLHNEVLHQMHRSDMSRSGLDVVFWVWVSEWLCWTQEPVFRIVRICQVKPDVFLTSCLIPAALFTVWLGLGRLFAVTVTFVFFMWSHKKAEDTCVTGCCVPFTSWTRWSVWRVQDLEHACRCSSGLSVCAESCMLPCHFLLVNCVIPV